MNELKLVSLQLEGEVKMEKKKELINLIEAIEDEKAFSYLLGFVHTFCQRYLRFVNGKWIK